MLVLVSRSISSSLPLGLSFNFFFFFFNDPATTEISPLPLHDALPISRRVAGRGDRRPPPNAPLGEASNLDGDGTPHRPGRRVHRPCLRRHPRRGVRAPRAARRRLDAGRPARDYLLRDRLPQTPRLLIS